MAAQYQRIPKRKNTLYDAVSEKSIPAVKTEKTVSGGVYINLAENIFKKNQGYKNIGNKNRKQDASLPRTYGIYCFLIIQIHFFCLR
jgi:hypothetical protein